MPEQVQRLRFIEAFWGGLSLLCTTIIWFGVRLENIEVFDIGTTDPSDEDELVSFHDKIEEYRDALLACAGLLWITLIFVLIHIYCMKRVFETLFTYASFGFWKWIYIFTWIVNCVILCCVTSCAIVVVAYYDWEFTTDDSTDDTSYTGYYIQLLLIRFVILLGDAVMFASAINASIPWLLLIFTSTNHCLGSRIGGAGTALAGTGSSGGVKVDTDDDYNNNDNNDSNNGNEIRLNSGIRDNIISNLLCCKCDKNIWNIVLIIFVILIYLGAFIDMFDWNGSGFWSIGGYSQTFGIIILLSYFLISCWLFYIAAKIDNIYTFLTNIHAYATIKNKNEDDFQL